MVRPVAFASNAQTLSDNHFQIASEDAQQAQSAALEEFNQLVQLLEHAGVSVVCFDDSATPHTPDSLFPNNWFSTHVDGLCLYPMKPANRRLERKRPILDWLKARYGTVWDYTDGESEEAFLEGTGSMVLDRVHQRAYACRSSRTDATMFDRWCQQHNYEPVVFDAVDRTGNSIYHTNVLMSVGDGIAVFCEDACSPSDQEKVKAELSKTGHEVVCVSFDQLDNFCGNVLMLRGESGFVMAMSQTAYTAFSPEQRNTIERYATIVHAPIPTIEKHGGGSVRCMLAELF
jgi:hypothetical protein